MLVQWYLHSQFLLSPNTIQVSHKLSVQGVYANRSLPIHLNTAYDVRATDAHSIVPPKAAHVFFPFFLPAFTLFSFVIFAMFVVIFWLFLDINIFNCRRNTVLFCRVSRALNYKNSQLQPQSLRFVVLPVLRAMD